VRLSSELSLRLDCVCMYDIGCVTCNESNFLRVSRLPAAPYFEVHHNFACVHAVGGGSTQATRSPASARVALRWPTSSGACSSCPSPCGKCPLYKCAACLLPFCSLHLYITIDLIALPTFLSIRYANLWCCFLGTCIPSS
jgi:hypothetical protein